MLNFDSKRDVLYKVPSFSCNLSDDISFPELFSDFFLTFIMGMLKTLFLTRDVLNQKQIRKVNQNICKRVQLQFAQRFFPLSRKNFSFPSVVTFATLTIFVIFSASNYFLLLSVICSTPSSVPRCNRDQSYFCSLSVGSR